VPGPVTLAFPSIPRFGGDMRIIGIDPGSRATGYGVVERRDRRVVHIAHGTVRTGQGQLGARLAEIHEMIAGVVRREAPDVAVVEQVFVAANVRSALVLGQARGAVLAAVGAAGLPIFELAPRAIKNAVVGTGTASKAQVQAMVARLLSLDRAPSRDAADALAAAICQAHVGSLAGVAPHGRGRRRRRIASESELGRTS
jgi:crossover junction endodeoxyribonuclease RuvC